MRTALIACFISLLAALSATAEEVSFQSPSGNIKCVLSDFDFGQSAECDLQDAVPSFSTPPEDCEFDWGNRFYVLNTGQGMRSCWSDAYFQPGDRVLAYGRSVTLGGVTCLSQRTGVTCTNENGGGFTVRRAEQILF